MNGYRTKIFEMGAKPGGQCTSWKKEGYTISGCIHWFMGAGPKASHYRVWEELGAVQGRKMVYYEQLLRYEMDDGQAFNFFTDIDRLEEHMKVIAPEDNTVIEEFVKGIRAFLHFNPPVDKAPELFGPFDMIKMMPKMFPFMRTMQKWKKVTSGDFAQRFRNPLLQKFFLTWGPPPGPGSKPGQFPMLGMLMALASMHRKSTGYPIGGSGELSEAIARRYVELGGEIQYGAKVTRVLVENDRAVGVGLVDGSEHRADYTISAADGYTTIFNMLEGKYVDETIQGYYDHLPKFPAIVHVALGVDRTFEDFPFSSFGVDFPLKEAVTIAGNKMNRLRINHIHNFDPTLAPQGKTLLRIWFPSEYGYWDAMRNNPDLYRKEKEEIANKVISIVDARFPGLGSQVEMRDVATPLTYERFTGNWHGSFEGWLPSIDTFGMRMKKNLPGLGDFYMTGQWVEPGGTIAFVAVSGRNVIQLICKQDKRRFLVQEA